MTADVTLPAWMLAGAFLVSAAVGYTSCYFGVVKIGARLMRRPTNRRNDDMAEKPTPRNVTTGFVIITVLVAMLLVIAGATAVNYYRVHEQDERDKADAAADQRQQEAYDACLTQWGDELTDTLTMRSAAAIKLDRALGQADRAADRRSDATAAVLETALQLMAVPPQAEVTDLQANLEEARAANEAVRRADAVVRDAKRELRDTREENDYETPTLACSDEKADSEDTDQ